MNERIKELAVQSGMGPWGIGNGDDVTEIVEKFAELIVQDCCSGSVSCPDHLGMSPCSVPEDCHPLS